MTLSLTALDQVLAYAARGWRVFPLHWPVYVNEQTKEIGCSCGDRRCSVGKHPLAELVPHGVKDATTDEAVIRKWYAAYPDCNWAIATGADSNLVIVDVDPRHGGDESLRDVEAKMGALPLTPRVLTGGGGTHYYFHHPGGGKVKNSSSRIGIGIDLKADGGYVVAPPSMHLMRRAYRWDIGAHVEDLEAAEPPSWLYEREGATSYTVAGAGPLPTTVPEGLRDNTMTSYAGTLRSRGLTELEIYESLLIVNQRFDPPLVDRDIRRIAHSVSSYEPGEFVNVPLETAKPEPILVEDFPAEYLTDLLQKFGRQAAATYDTNPATVICTMLAFASGAMGTLWTTRLNPEWEESALLWIGLVGDPGTKKTPLIKAVGRPYLEWHKNELGRFYEEYKQYQEAKLRLKRDQLPPEPKLHQRLIDDTTIEALSKVLESEPRGVLLDRDELTGFVASMNQYKSKGGADRSNWLSIWSGRHITINRKGDARPIYIERPYVSLVGGIQPERLGALLSEDGNDGFLDRFLFAVMATGTAKARHGSSLEKQVIQRWRAVIKALLDNELPALLPLSKEADERWQYWSERHANERNDPMLDPVLKGFWSKAEGTALRLALVHQVISHIDGDGSDSAIETPSVEAAWRLLQYFKSTTRKVYSEIGENEMDRRLDRVMAFIDGAGGIVTARHLQRRQVAGIKKSTEAEMLLDELQDRGLGTVLKENVTGGRRVTFTMRQRADRTVEDD